MDIIGFLVDLIGLLLRLAWRAVARLFRGVWKLMRPRPSTFGDARWASSWALRRAGFLKDTGLIIGKKRVFGRMRLLRFNGDGHVSVIAPPGAGKTSGFVIPNLLEHPGSVIVNDPKGENFDITHRQRQKFGKVYALNLIDINASHRFNPLDMVRIETEHAADDAELIADLMVSPDVRGEAHWDDKARMRLTGMILYVMSGLPPERRNLLEVRRQLMQVEADFDDMLERMEVSPFETVKEAASDFRRMTDGERSGVLSNMEKATKLWSADRPIARIVTKSDFDLMSFKDETRTLYIVIPPGKRNTYAPLLRLMAGLALEAMTRNMRRPAHPVLLMFDEARALGRLDQLPQAIAEQRGYGVRVIPIWQDERQPLQLYGDEGHSIISMCTLQLFFGLSDDRTAETLSKRIGQYTVRSHQTGQSGEVDDLMHTGRSRGESEAGRPLIYASEIIRSPDVFAIMPKVDAIRCKGVRYFEERRWAGLYDRWRGMAAPDSTIEPPESLSDISDPLNASSEPLEDFIPLDPANTPRNSPGAT